MLAMAVDVNNKSNSRNRLLVDASWKADFDVEAAGILGCDLERRNFCLSRLFFEFLHCNMSLNDILVYFWIW